MSHEHNHDHFPCLSCNPHSYIRMVQHMIERCLLLHMSRDHCVEALSKHANIQPLVTLTVWRELHKENRDFFQSYSHATSPTTPLGNRHIQRVSRFQRSRKSHRK